SSLSVISGSKFGLFVRRAAPQLNFIFEIDIVFTLNPFPDFFGQRQRVRRPRVIALGDNKVSVFRRNHGASPATTFHSQVVNHLPRSDFGLRRIFEKATSRTRAVWLRRQTLVLG